jgi:hypothetical protein
LYLVDAKSKVPVGLVPDFIPDNAMDERCVKIRYVVYNRFCEYVGNNGVRVATLPLRYLTMSEG